MRLDSQGEYVAHHSVPPELFLAHRSHLNREKKKCMPRQNSRKPGLGDGLDREILRVWYPLLVGSGRRIPGNVLVPEICLRTRISMADRD